MKNAFTVRRGACRRGHWSRRRRERACQHRASTVARGQERLCVHAHHQRLQGAGSQQAGDLGAERAARRTWSSCRCRCPSSSSRTGSRSSTATMTACCAGTAWIASSSPIRASSLRTPVDDHGHDPPGRRRPGAARAAVRRAPDAQEEAADSRSSRGRAAAGATRKTTDRTDVRHIEWLPRLQWRRGSENRTEGPARGPARRAGRTPSVDDPRAAPAADRRCSATSRGCSASRHRAASSIR